MKWINRKIVTGLMYTCTRVPIDSMCVCVCVCAELSWARQQSEMRTERVNGKKSVRLSGHHHRSGQKNTRKNCTCFRREREHTPTNPPVRHNRRINSNFFYFPMFFFSLFLCLTLSDLDSDSVPLRADSQKYSRTRWQQSSSSHTNTPNIHAIYAHQMTVRNMWQ